MRLANAGQDFFQTRGFRLTVLLIQIMLDLCNLSDRFVLDAERFHQNLEGAEVAYY